MVSTRKRDYDSDNSNTSSTVSRRQSTGAPRKRNDSGESRDSNGPEKVSEVATPQAIAKTTRRLSKNSVQNYASSPEPSEASFESLSQDVGISQSVERPQPETPSTVRRSRRLSNSSDSGLTTPIQTSKRVRSSDSASSSPSKDLIDVKQFTRKSIRDGSKEAAELLSPIKESPGENQLFEEITSVSTSPPKLDGGRRSSDSNKKGTKLSPAQASIDKMSEPSHDATPNSSELHITEISQADKENDHSITVESEHLSGITEVKEEPEESEVQMINPPPVIVSLLEPKSEARNEDPTHSASVLPSGADVMRNIPRGKPKSGRPWKEIKTNARNMYQDKGAKVGLEKAMKLKRELQLVKGMERRIKEERVKKFEDLKKRQEDNKQRREANERRGEVTQVVSAAKVKRMKKKQLKQIQKRDTTKVV